METPTEWQAQANGVPGGVLAEVLAATAKINERQNFARINEEALARFVESGEASLEKYKRAVTRVPLPLKFDDNAQEINFHSLLALLSFGGAHEPALVKLTGSTVEDSVKFGLIGSHLARERLDATWMKNAHVGSISEGFKIPVREPAPSGIPGVTVDKPGALVAHAQALCSALNSTGEALLSRGYSDMAQFVIHSAKSDRGAEGMVRSLVGALPSFRDAEKYEGEEVLMLKNAQVLAGELCARLGPSVEALRFDDVHELTAVVDADVITALTAIGILERAALNDEDEDGEQGGNAFKAEETIALRAVAVQACHRLAKSLGEEYQAHDMSLFLKRLGRRKVYKDLPRFIPHVSGAL